MKLIFSSLDTNMMVFGIHFFNGDGSLDNDYFNNLDMII
jgi:hypothetical protein